MLVSVKQMSHTSVLNHMYTSEKRYLWLINISQDFFNVVLLLPLSICMFVTLKCLRIPNQFKFCQNNTSKHKIQFLNA